ncbi:MAG: nonstructural protein [Arizlama microvirus]|nr:MAG: nonstructural protein [Arizlama microvirus]
MLYNVYVVKDKLAQEAGPPFVAVNDKVALRQFKQMGIPEVLKKEYELLKIGYYDSLEVTITPDIVSDLIYLEQEEKEDE